MRFGKWVPEFWEKLFQKNWALRWRFLGASAIALVGLGLEAALYSKTGNYFPSIIFMTVILIALYGGLVPALILSLLVVALADRFFVKAWAGSPGLQQRLEHLIILAILVAVVNFLIYSLRYSYVKVIEAKQQAERATHMAEQALALVSHDVRNPLAAVKMMAQLVLRDPEDATRSRQLAGRMVDALDRADTLIQTLLDVSSIRAGKPISLSYQFCDLKSVIEKTLEDLALNYGERFRFEATGPVHGNWSEAGIRRALENLVTNAIKYGSPDSPVTVKLSQSGGRALISVHNQGDEISPDEQTKLFEAHYRSRSAEAGGREGWGLGLTLVRGIVEAHGGSIEVDSGKGRGTTFTLRFPLGGKSAS